MAAAACKFVSGASIHFPRFFESAVSQGQHNAIPRFIRISDALHLGVQVNPLVLATRKESAFINVFSCDNPVMFHDDFCAENDIPIVVGRGIIADPQLRAAARKLTKSHGWQDKQPQRWIALQDAIECGLLALLSTSSTAVQEQVMECTEEFAKCPTRSHLYRNCIWPDLFSHVPHLNMCTRQPIDASQILFHVRQFTIPPLVQCSSSSSRSVATECDPHNVFFDESRWPILTTRLFRSHWMTSPAVARISMNCGILQKQHSMWWLYRGEADLLRLPYRGDRKVEGGAALCDVADDRHSTFFLNNEDFLDPEAATFAMNYRPEFLTSQGTINRLGWWFSLQLTAHASAFRQQTTPWWTVVNSQPVAVENFEVNKAVPELEVSTEKGITRFVNLQPRR